MVVDFVANSMKGLHDSRLTGSGYLGWNQPIRPSWSCLWVANVKKEFNGHQRMDLFPSHRLHNPHDTKWTTEQTIITNILLDNLYYKKHLLSGTKTSIVCWERARPCYSDLVQDPTLSSFRPAAKNLAPSDGRSLIKSTVSARR
jgi:hypothetical protein